jgi:hypothetical protein
LLHTDRTKSDLAATDQPLPSDALGVCRQDMAGTLVRMFDLRDLVFDAEFLSLPVGETFGIGEGAVGFTVDGFLKSAMAGLEVFNPIRVNHGSS